MRKILIFGASGLVGSNLIEYYSAGSDVIGTLRNISGSTPNRVEYNHSNKKMSNLDVASYDEIHYTIHSPHSDDRDFVYKLRDNFNLYYNLVQLLCSRNYRGTLNYYSTEGIDRIAELPFGANQFNYSYTHLLCENLKRCEHIGFKVNNIRLPNLYGFNFFTQEFSGLICNFLNSALFSRRIELLSDGLDERAMCGISAENNLGLNMEFFSGEDIYRIKSKRYNVMTFANTCALISNELLGGNTRVLVKGKDNSSAFDLDELKSTNIYPQIKLMGKKIMDKMS